MKTNAGKVALLCAASLMAAGALAKDPPLPARTMPGVPKGESNAGWMAPYVHAAQASVARNRLTTIQWFTRDGKLRREYSGSHVDRQWGYLSDFVAGKQVIMGLSGDWQITLPKKGGPAGYITATPNGRSFYHQHHPAEGQIAVDVYVGGELRGTVGPFVQYDSSSIYPGHDGSVALLTWTDANKKKVQIVAARPDASVGIQVQCDDPVTSPRVASDARGVLLQPNGNERNTFSYYTNKGKIASFKPGFNADCVTWLPKSATALMSSAIGHDHRYHLVDWTTGKELWAIDDPCKTRVPGMSASVAVVKDYLLFAGREFVEIGGKQEPVRCVYAVAVTTGKTVARWRPTPLQATPAEVWFFAQGEQLYLMTRQEFSEILLHDIAAKKRGWQ